MTAEDIVNKFQKLADANGYRLSNFAERVAKAKLRLFGEKEWAKCPCVQDGKHACISPLCKRHIEEEGRCHCNLFLNK